VAACGLPDVRASRFYSYSVIHQPVISTSHDFQFVDSMYITSHLHLPLGKPFLYLDSS